MIPAGNGEARRVFEEVDIFKMEVAGILWRGAFSNLDAAKTRIKQLLASDPGEYFTYIHSTGNKLFFKPNGHNGTR